MVSCQYDVVSKRSLANMMPCQDDTASRRHRANATKCQHEDVSRLHRVRNNIVRTTIRIKTMSCEDGAAPKTAACRSDTLSRRRRANTTPCQKTVLCPAGVNSTPRSDWAAPRQYDTVPRRCRVNMSVVFIQKTAIAHTTPSANTMLCQHDAVSTHRRTKTMSCQHDVMPRRRCVKKTYRQLGVMAMRRRANAAPS